MRLSPQRHTLAVLRLLVGITQKELATILECSTPTVQAIELGKLKLSDKLAGLISHKTGINLAWLLTNDVGKSPVDIKGLPYNKESFENFQALAHDQKHNKGGTLQASFSFIANIHRLASLILRAHINDESALCAYKLAKAFEDLEKQFHVSIEDKIAIKTAIAAEKRGNTSDLIEGFFTSLRRDLKKNEGNLKRPKYTSWDFIMHYDGQIVCSPEQKNEAT